MAINFIYILISDGLENYIIAEDLFDKFCKRLEKEFSVISSCVGSELIGIKIKHPFLDINIFFINNKLE